jgi:hypothetical protein
MDRSSGKDLAVASFDPTTRNLFLDLMFGDDHGSAFPSSYDIALSQTQPTDNGSNVTEPADTYARVQVPNDTAHWPDASGQLKRNGQDITFPQPMGSWGTVGWFAIYDHGTSTFRGWGAFTIPLLIGAHSEAPSIDAGMLVVVG